MNSENEQRLILDMMISLFVLKICNDDDVIDISREIYR